MNLNDLKIGEEATIENLIQNEFTLKLVEMGLYRGKKIRKLYNSISKDPICIQLVNNSKLILRKEEADSIKLTFLEIEI